MKDKSLETKSCILNATLELVAENGFHGTSISQIADKSGVNVGSMYYHFANKDDILKALYIDCKHRITQYVFNNIPEDMPPEESLKRMMWNIVRYFSENKAEYSFIEQFEKSPYLAEVTSNTEYLEMMDSYMKIYEIPKQQGLVKDMPIGVTQSLITGAIIALTKYFLSGKEALEEPILTDAINAIWDMVKK